MDAIVLRVTAQYTLKIRNTDFDTSVRGWTPLFIACVEGHISIVKLLIEAGADQHKVDCFGWTAKEHATFRGYLHLALLLCSSGVNDPLPPNTSPITVEQLPVLDLIATKDNDSSIERARSHILVTLGSPNTREEISGVCVLRACIQRNHITFCGSNGCLAENNSADSRMSLGRPNPSQTR